MKTNLTNFLLDDVRALLDIITNNPEMAAMKGGNFETLEDFAIYWNTHINAIAQ